MTDSSTAEKLPDADEAAAFRQEAERLNLSKTTNHNRSRWSVFGGTAALVVGLMVGALSGHMWIMLIPTVLMFAAATSFFALERGRHPLWGLISIPGLVILNEMSDLTASRLADIESRLTGTPPKRVESRRQGQAIGWSLGTLACYYLANSGDFDSGRDALCSVGGGMSLTAVYQALRLLFERRVQEGVPISTVVTILWTSGVAVLGVSMLNDVQHRRTDELLVTGRHAIVRLPPGWELDPQAKASDVDIAVLNRKKNYFMTVFSIAKRDAPESSLAQHAAGWIDGEIKRLGKETVPGTLEKSATKQGALIYTLRHAPQGGRDITYHFLFWEFGARFYRVVGNRNTQVPTLELLQLESLMQSSVKVIE